MNQLYEWRNIQYQPVKASDLSNFFYFKDMNHSIKSIRPFIGAKNFDESRAFYSALGFQEVRLGKMSLFKQENFGFYLQDYYSKDWVNNSMIFLEVSDTRAHRETLLGLELTDQFKKVRISEIVVNDWGMEYFVHDPSGILLHFGEFN
ncbi:MAG: glyoxalase [Marinoscillum sp.]